MTHHKNLLEALIFAKADPVKLKELQQVTGLSLPELEVALAYLKADYEGRGVQLVEVAEGYQFRTRPEFSEYLGQLLHPPLHVQLSKAALETLAIIGYRQPIARRDIERIRGVDTSSVLQTLFERALICEVGRGEALGHPVLYGTTELFLQVFGLKNLSELPPLAAHDDAIEMSEQ